MENSHPNRSFRTTKSTGHATNRNGLASLGALVFLAHHVFDVSSIMPRDVCNPCLSSHFLLRPTWHHCMQMVNTVSASSLAPRQTLLHFSTFDFSASIISTCFPIRSISSSYSLVCMSFFTSPSFLHHHHIQCMTLLQILSLLRSIPHSVIASSWSISQPSRRHRESLILPPLTVFVPSFSFINSTFHHRSFVSHQ